MAKTGKEIKINDFENYKIVFGSVNNKHPKTIYINISAWAEPIYDGEDNTNYAKIIKDFHKKIKQELFIFFDSNSDITSDYEKEKTIVDLDIRESGIRYGKRSFMNCEITLFLTIEIQANSEIMKDIVSRLTPLLIDDVFNTNKIFNFNLKKI